MDTPNAIQSTPRNRRPFAAPSPALLSLLAALTPCAALPTPDFLCPSLIPRRRTRRARRDSPSAPAPTPAPAPAPSSSSSPATTPFPVKYLSQGGTWYPAESWYLHGHSTHQLPASSTPRAHALVPLSSSLARPGIDSVDDAVSEPSSSTTTDMPTQFTDTLPTGWKPMPQRTKFYSVPLIVVFSLILAVAITLVLAGTVLWHKNRRRPRDAERDKLDPDPDEGARALRRAQRGAAKKERMWGRWRREARAGLRRRRRKGRAPEEDERSAESSPRTSMASERPDSAEFLSSMRAHEPNAPAPAPPPSPVPPSTPPRAASPPAVHSPPAYRRARRAPASPPPDPAPCAAHVATDDKAVLARLHTRASAPAADAPPAAAPAAPQWEDERLEDFDDARAGPSLPPPPKLRYYAHEEEPEDAGPSAPPFAPSAPHGAPSAPPGDGDAGVPSAPPAEEEDEEAAASAPPLEEPPLEEPPRARLPRYSP